MEAVNWVCDNALDEHVWVSEQTIPVEEAKVLEALQYDREIPCKVQWRMLWFSTSTSLNNELLNDEEIFGKYYEAVNLAFQNVSCVQYFVVSTPRISFSKTVRKVLGDMPERV